MDIAERRKPQDGRIDFALPLKNIDMRVSTLPTLHGEKIVMRLLGSITDTTPLNLDKLGIAPGILQPLQETLHAPNGILFVTGPTGSGKTTTLYAALNYINTPAVNIMTIEDPIEYQLPSLTQVQVNERAGRSFAAVLRAVLRQDPDVILVGEIRDTETATIAVKAALTGHTVLASLHTNNALQAMLRLVDMGVEPYAVAPSVIGVLGQRLVRMICEQCRVPYTPEQEVLARHFFWNDPMALPVFYRGEGCENCAHTGYRGRLGIHEFLRVSLAMRDYILQGRTYMEIRELAYREGFRDMRFDGFVKALQGLTTLEEVVRVTAAD
jgi:type IV pilus assembly protein PilB